ncbi:DUF4157 domain-containing protein [Streptomyces sp. NBC_00572]|uniref:eCIS core domain-containing protein n=1 Tax=Streptomyces sp. NBC_00572 TaxID=2903664 RepID=UPI00225855F9|nr:DUF4157 domain-containing protein [Streptomyces sp. NBC_00572]MCX4981340.1 DUF4157 domain-containing protein [Streptomyces sp. NBC_00572]
MQHDHGPEHTTERQSSAPRKSAPPSGAGLAALQRTAGNAAVVRLLQRAGHAYAEPPAPEAEQHRHGAGCGHPQTAEQPRPPSVQRSAVHDVLKGAGRPLDTPVREDMEARLGADFSDVRLHDDSAARTSATEVGARAYTSGNHIVIGDGGGDKHTLAHELTHVIQQRQGPVAGTDNGSGLAVSDPSDRFERAAEANATRVMRSAAPLRDDTADPRRSTSETPTGPVAVQRMDWEPARLPRLTRERSFNLTGPGPTSGFLADVPVHGEHSQRVGMADVLVGQIQLSDNERPPTQFGTQEDHIVAWTLVRETLKAFSHRPARSLINYIQSGIQKLSRQSTERGLYTQSVLPRAPADFAEKITETQDLIRQMMSNPALLSEWRTGLSRLIRLYVEAYQLSPLATQKGNSGGHGEGSTMAYLRGQENLPAHQREPAQTLESYVNSLHEMPRNQQLTARTRAELWENIGVAFPGVAGSAGRQPYALPQQQQPAYTDANVQGLIEPVHFGRLDSGFTVMLSVETYSDGLQYVDEALMSQRERPPTQYGGTTQRSHTIAWKLTHEAAVNSLNGKSVGDVLAWAERTLQYCDRSGAPKGENSDWVRLGAQLTSKLASCRNALASRVPDHVWATVLSNLVRGCLTLENSSRMATGGGAADELGAALGHGEAALHATLRRYDSRQENYTQEDARERAVGFFDTGAVRTRLVRQVSDAMEQGAGATGRRSQRHRESTGDLADEVARRFNELLDGREATAVIDRWVATSREAYRNVDYGSENDLRNAALAQLLVPRQGQNRGLPFTDAERRLFPNRF